MQGFGLIIIGVVAAAFLGTNIYTVVTVGKASTHKDNKAKIATSIYNTTIVNAVFTLILGFTAYFYITEDESLYDAYVMIMLHVALFISLLGSSVAVLHQLN
jgi:cbb3-type cytochrome oxidase subunit 1